jgi:UDPglucose--hexose-1-phosphate uridylyltransferase
MSQWRQDPLTGRWVIIAADRGRRPNEFRLAARTAGGADACPFCPGREDRTTPEVAAFGRPAGAGPDTPGWRARAFPNMYPALDGNPSAPAAAPDDLVVRPGVGSHEVVVYTPDHDAGPATAGAAGLADLLLMLRDRTRALAAEPDRRYVLAFVNHGPESGATLAHPHAQVIAAPVVPDTVRAKVQRFTAAHGPGDCLLCGLARQEEARGDRLVAADEDGIVLAPWASRLPYEMLLVPRRHAADLAGVDDGEATRLAALLARVLQGLEAIHPDPPLNLVVHGAPLVRSDDDAAAAAAFHWHIEILPRLTRLAGFEAGTGFHINAVPPETAARRLRGEGD